MAKSEIPPPTLIRGSDVKFQSRIRFVIDAVGGFSTVTVTSLGYHTIASRPACTRLELRQAFVWQISLWVANAEQRVLVHVVHRNRVHRKFQVVT